MQLTGLSPQLQQSFGIGTNNAPMQATPTNPFMTSIGAGNGPALPQMQTVPNTGLPMNSAFSASGSTPTTTPQAQAQTQAPAQNRHAQNQPE